MSIQGLRDTSNFVTDQRPKNWREGILLSMPNGTAPLFALTSLMRSRTVVDDPEFNWWEKNMPTQRLTLSASITAAVTTLPVGGVGAGRDNNAETLKAGHLLYIEQSGEIVRVTTDPTASTAITVARGFSGSTAAGVNPASANPNLFVIGSAYEENSDAPTGINYDPTKRTNYTQIFRNTMEMSRTAQKTRLRTGDAVREAKREVLELHSEEVEKALWFGKPAETTLSGKPLRTTGGILHYLETFYPANIKTYAASTNLEQLEEDLKAMFDFGSQEKMGFGGNRAMLTIQQIVRKNASYELVQGQKEFGMNVTKLVSPFGTLVMKTHPLFNQFTSAAATSGYRAIDSWMFCLDMGELTWRPFQGDDTRWEPKLQDNGLDGMKSGYLTEAGLEIHHPRHHYLIKGLRVAAADA